MSKEIFSNILDEFNEYTDNKSCQVNELSEHADNASQLASIKTVEDMRIYLDTTGDMEGLVKKFGVPEDEINAMIACFSYCRDWIEVQQIIENPDEEYGLAYERGFCVYQQTYIDRAAELMRKRERLCKVGIRPIREFLRRKYIRDKDIDARIYQLAMDIEEKSIMVKKIYWLDHDIPIEKEDEFIDIMEEHKAKLLRKLIRCYKEAGYEYGWKNGYCNDYPGYLFFDLPNGEQISFRTHFSKDELEEFPEYTKRWNGIFRHTLHAIENNLLLKYPNLKNITPPRPKGLKEMCSPEAWAFIFGEYDPTSGQFVLDDKLRKKLGVSDVHYKQLKNHEDSENI